MSEPLSEQIAAAAQEVQELKALQEELEAKLSEAKEKLEALELKQNEAIGLLSPGDHVWVMNRLAFLGRLLKSPDVIDETVDLVEEGDPSELLRVDIETKLGCDCGVTGISYKITLKTVNKGVLALIRKHLHVKSETDYNAEPTPSLRTHWHGNWDWFTHVVFSDEVCSFKDS